MRTLLLSPRYTDDTLALRTAAIDQGWAVQRLPAWRAPSELRDRDCVVYGEALFCVVVAQTIDLALIEAPFDWLTSLPTSLLGRQVSYATLKDALEVCEPRFIKPADDKSFAPAVYPRGDALPSIEGLSLDTPVLMADPVHFEVEYRHFIVEGRSVASSPYWRHGALAQDEQGQWTAPQDEAQAALEFAHQVLAHPEVRFPPAGVLDVGRLQGSWAVIEANPAWGAGLYGCAPTQALQAIARSVLPRRRLGDEDSAWVLAR